jgi:hypothetical protein
VCEWTPQGLRLVMGDESIVHLTAAWLMSGSRGFIKWIG